MRLLTAALLLCLSPLAIASSVLAPTPILGPMPAYGAFMSQCVAGIMGQLAPKPRKRAPPPFRPRRNKDVSTPPQRLRSRGA